MEFKIISLMLVSLVYACGGHPTVSNFSMASSNSGGGIRSGRSTLGVVPTVDGLLRPKAICNFKCTRERQPICAVDDGQNDFVMFDNYCELKLFNCQSQKEFRGVGMEMCSKNLPNES